MIKLKILSCGDFFWLLDGPNIATRDLIKGMQEKLSKGLADAILMALKMEERVVSQKI
jgi:hypothetical protein